MSDCTAMYDALLEADLEALEGAGDTPVGRHVRDCPACAAEAARILRATASLDAALCTPPGLDARALVARALADDTVQPDSATALPAGPVRLRSANTTRWAALAVAACMAALFVWAERDRPMPGTPWRPSDAPAPTVETASGNVAVIETDDPDITVIWIF